MLFQKIEKASGSIKEINAQLHQQEVDSRAEKGLALQEKSIQNQRDQKELTLSGLTAALISVLAAATSGDLKSIFVVSAIGAWLGTLGRYFQNLHSASKEITSDHRKRSPQPQRRLLKNWGSDLNKKLKL